MKAKCAISKAIKMLFTKFGKNFVAWLRVYDREWALDDRAGPLLGFLNVRRYGGKPTAQRRRAFSLVRPKWR